MKIEIYFDTASAYSWFALEVLKRYRTLWRFDLCLIPLSLPAAVTRTGNIPPATTEQKRKYLQKDLLRNRSFYQVDFRGMPSNFMAKEQPFKSRPAQHLLIAASRKWGPSSDELLTLTLEFFNTFMDTLAGEKVIVDDALLARVCQNCKLAPEVAEELITLSKTKSIYDELTENTTKAIQLGTFGAPLIVVEELKDAEFGNFFFGSDRFEQIAFFLNKPWLGPTPNF